MPTFAKSQKLSVSPALFSAFWMMMTLLAAPKINKLPAIVLPAAKAIIPAVEIPAFVSIGRYNATKGTLEIS